MGVCNYKLKRQGINYEKRELLGFSNPKNEWFNEQGCA